MRCYPRGDSDVADSETFEKTCSELARTGALDSLSARGTIRIILKASGLDAKTVDAREMLVVVDKLLPGELIARGVEAPESICSQIGSALQLLPKSRDVASPESVFARLGGDS